MRRVGDVILKASLIWLFYTLSSCGPHVHVDVSGKVDGVVSGGTTNTGTVTVIPPAEVFLPFFATQCQTLQPGQFCYSPDPASCAECLANALEKDLGTQSPLPTPSDGPTPEPSPSPTCHGKGKHCE